VLDFLTVAWPTADCKLIAASLQGVSEYFIEWMLCLFLNCYA